MRTLLVEKRIVFSVMLLSCVALSAQTSKIRVDLNDATRGNMDEILEPGYVAWGVPAFSEEASIHIDGVQFTLTASGQMTSAWNRVFELQGTGNRRLTGDGIKLMQDQAGYIDLCIKGLPTGKHTIQTYHNSWMGPESYQTAPISVYCNGKLIHNSVPTSLLSETSGNSCALQTTFKAGKGKDVHIRFVTTQTADGKALQECSPILNGFEIDMPSVKDRAQNPSPANDDLHADGDKGSVLLAWEAANAKVKRHHLFFGTDSAAVAAADFKSPLYAGALTNSQWTAENTYNLEDYYWRVDVESQSGDITEGCVWHFRPRHLAFRDAEGYGRFATGGRGGKVIYVTNLNDSGPGSFRDAIENAEGPRTVVFAVSGIIDLKSRIICHDKFITIAGQTAPGKGICFSSAPIGIGSEGICRFIRSRIGAGTTYDGMGMAGSRNSITDHCSISWTIDEGFSSRNGHNFTLQRTMIAEALNIAGHAHYQRGKAHGYAASIGGDIGTFHHNLLVHNSGRNWSMAGGLDGDGYYSGRLDIFNNVVYNWNTRTTDGGAHEVNFVNNYYKAGPASEHMYILTAELEGLGKGSQSYYYKGNVLQKQDGSFACDGTDDTCGRTYKLMRNQVLDWTLWVDKPFFPSYARIESAKDAYKNVLSDVGCNMPVFDEHDTRVVNETLAGSYQFSGSISGLPGLIDNEKDCGGYENYGTEERNLATFDSDLDGLPNWWEKLYGSNPDSPKGDFSDANADPDHDGYTALEDYLEWMATPHYYSQAGRPKAIDLNPLFKGYTANARISSVQNSDNATVNYNGMSLSINPNSGFTGISYFDVVITDDEGSTMTRRIGLLVM